MDQKVIWSGACWTPWSRKDVSHFGKSLALIQIKKKRRFSRLKRAVIGRFRLLNICDPLIFFLFAWAKTHKKICHRKEILVMTSGRFRKFFHKNFRCFIIFMNTSFAVGKVFPALSCKLLRSFGFLHKIN